MDSMTYHYNKNTNQLAEVTDVIPSTYYTIDIDNETSKHNYRYNGIGELASDSIAGIDSIYWTVYGKVKKIVKTNNDSLVFMYDPLGNRLEQRNFPHSGTSDTTKYTRDAQGNIMAIYDRKKDTVRLSEFDIYGNRRLGSLDTVLRMQKFITGHGTLDSLTISYLERQKQYELDNHLGNVLVTVSDGKTPSDTMPIVVNVQDYYPFGMVEPGRLYNMTNDSSYRYGFNGQLKDNNIYGINDAYTAQYWEYDPRIGRRWNTDEKSTADISPYSTLGDNPIWHNDILGDDFKNGYEKEENKSKDKLEKAKSVKAGFDQQKSGFDVNGKNLTRVQKQILRESAKADRAVERDQKKFEKIDTKYQCVQKILLTLAATNPDLYSTIQTGAESKKLNITVYIQHSNSVMYDDNSAQTGSTDEATEYNYKVSISSQKATGADGYSHLQLNDYTSQADILKAVGNLVHSIGHYYRAKTVAGAYKEKETYNSPGEVWVREYFTVNQFDNKLTK